MAIYQKQVRVSGDWVDKRELIEKGIKKAKILSETEPMPSNFKDKNGETKMQDVCKVQFQGIAEVKNVSLDRATLNGLVEAFGTDSKDWINKVLSVETEKTRVAGKTGIGLYLIPDGFERVDTEDGYPLIQRKKETQESFEKSLEPEKVEADDKINSEDVPF